MIEKKKCRWLSSYSSPRKKAKAKILIHCNHSIWWMNYTCSQQCSCDISISWNYYHLTSVVMGSLLSDFHDANGRYPVRELKQHDPTHQWTIKLPTVSIYGNIEAPVEKKECYQNIRPRRYYIMKFKLLHIFLLIRLLKTLKKCLRKY